MTASPTQRAIEAVFRIERARLIASLARMVRDVGLAEDLAQDAMVAALEQWPRSRIPDQPGAWLMSTARHRAIDRLRRAKLHRSKEGELTREIEEQFEMNQPDLDAEIDDSVGDDLLRLVFIACHPVLSPEARVALTLRLFGGLTTDEIARAFLVREPTIAQRIVRAKRTLTQAGVPFELPGKGELSAGAILGAGSHLPDLQRGLFRNDRRRLDASCPVRGSAATGSRALRTRTAGSRGARAGRTDGDPGFAFTRKSGRQRRADPAAGAGPQPLGSAADPARAQGLGEGRVAPRHAWPLHAAGHHRGLPRAGPPCRPDRLAAHRSAVRGRSRRSCPRRSSS